MLVHVELMQTSLCHLKIVFTVVKCFKLDADMPRCDKLQTRVCIDQEEMIKSIQSPQSATLLEKDSIADLPIKLSFKLL